MLVMIGQSDESEELCCIELLRQAGADPRAPVSTSLAHGLRDIPNIGPLLSELSHLDWAYLYKPHFYNYISEDGQIMTQVSPRYFPLP